MRIDIVTETFPPEVNGVATTLARFVDGLADRGHQLRVLRPRQDRDPPEALTVEARGYPEVLLRGMPIPRYPQLRLGLPAARTIRRLWSASPPALVHIATEGPLGWSALRTARAMGLPVTSDFRTHFDAYSTHYGIGWLRRPIASYLRRFHNRTATTMVPTRALRDRLSQAGLERLVVVGRGIDTALFDPARRCDALRARWGAGPDDPVILYVGRLAPEKNPQTLGATFEAIRRHVPRARLVLVGDGPSRTRLQQRFPDAIFAGMRAGEDLATHYASADLFLFPSETETFGNVTLEAMASGLAIIAYDYAAAAEHVAHGRSGLLSPVGDTRALIGSAVALATDLPRARAIGVHAREVAQSLQWGQLVAAMEAVLVSALTTPLPPTPPRRRFRQAPPSARGSAG